MPIPDYESLMLPVLESLGDGVERALREVRDIIADKYQLSLEERSERIPSGQNTVISSRVAWAKTYLQNAGLVECPERGRVRITESGKQLLSSHPMTIDSKFLEKYPTFLRFKSKSNSARAEQSLAESYPLSPANGTPLELLDLSYQALENATKDELLNRLRSCSPRFFEHVVVELLRAMGYGGVTGDGRVTKATGDGGIDGVIKEDKLGLDVVAIQAKRWDDSVGRPVLQAFVGSMDYVRAKKGVLITTAAFTRDALEFVEKIEGKKVVLIDGDQLVQFMFEHNVGVAITKTYSLKEVSQDFFSDDNL